MTTSRARRILEDHLIEWEGGGFDTSELREALLVLEGRGLPETPATRQEAVDQALQWGSTLSHQNIMMEVESGPEHRTQTLAHIAQADASEVIRLCALATVLP